MNIFLLEEHDFVAPDEVVLKGRRYDHAREILKVEEGADIRVGVVGGKLGTGKVLSCQDDCLRLRVTLEEAPPLKHSVTLVLAIARPPVLRRVLSAVSAMGIEEIHVIQTVRAEKSYWSSPVLNPGNIRQALVLGLEQSRDTILPKVVLHQRFRPFVEDQLPVIGKGKRCFLAHPHHAGACPSNVSEPLVLAVGPEGGFVDFEVEKLCAAGFEPVHLGTRVLRVETAVQALLGRLMPL